MFKRLMVSILVVILITLAVNQASAAVCRTYPYCKLSPGSVDLFGSVVSKYANKYDVAISLTAFAPSILPVSGDGYPPPDGWVDYATLGTNDTKCTCHNPGTNAWTAPGQNPPPSDVSFTGINILYYIPKNGRTLVFVNGLTEQPENIEDYCPNSNWFIDCVPEYIEYANIYEIIIQDIDGTKTCFVASSATLNDCYVDLNNVSYDTETNSYTGPEYECVGTQETTTNQDPFLFPLNGDGTCPPEIQ
jgi:hypothetical protein